MSRSRMMDVVVVGGGPGGLVAAAAAAERGAQVLLIDQAERLGGQIWRHRSPALVPEEARSVLERVRAARVTVANGARVLDAASPRELIIDFRGRVDRQPTRALILATGATERFLPFPGWTLPSVMGVGGLQAMLKSGLPLIGSRVVLAGSGPLLFAVAEAITAAGAELPLVAEQAGRRALLKFARHLLADPAKCVQAARMRWAFLGTRYRTGSWVVRAEGDDRLRAVVVSERGRERRYRCDWLGASFGLVPNTDLARLLGAAMQGEAIRVGPHQETSVPELFAVGECTGIKGDGPAMVEGEIAGRAAVGDLRGAAESGLARRRNAGRRVGVALGDAFAVRDELRHLASPETMLCRCEDVPMGAVDPTWSARQAKLWTRVGMGACQGSICGVACQTLFGWEGNAVRPPLGSPICDGWSSALTKPEP